MTSRLQHELKQTRPFSNPRLELVVQLARTNALLVHQWEQHLRPHGITLTQFNVLRILRGAGESGLCRHEVADRLVTPMPDASRLLDRMVRAGLVTRTRNATDRRMVKTCITARGLAILQELDGSSLSVADRQFAHLSSEDVGQLIRLLEKVRYPSGCCSDPVASPE